MRKLLLLIFLFVVASLIHSETFEQIFYEQLNKQRETKGLNVLVVDEHLEDMALLYAKLCQKNGKISHGLIPDDGIFTFYNAVAPKYQAVGEVLAYSTTLSAYLVLLSWMESESHRRQLMHPRNIAVGIAWVQGYYYVAYTGR